MLQVHASFILLTLWQFCRFTIILHSCCMQKTDNYHMTKINDIIRYWSDMIHTIHFCDVTGQFIITSSIAIKMANLIWCFVVKIRTFKKFVCQRFLLDTSHRYKQVVNLLMIKMSVLIFLPLSKFLKSRSAQSRRVFATWLFGTWLFSFRMI